MTEGSDCIRIDKWLWAARFFKTRALAKQAIETGKVLVNDQKAKAKRTIRVGDTVFIKQGVDEKTLVVLGLNDERRPYSEAKLLYEETKESIIAREKTAHLRAQAGHSVMDPGRKPTKKQRRERLLVKKDWDQGP